MNKIVLATFLLLNIGYCKPMQESYESMLSNNISKEFSSIGKGLLKMATKLSSCIFSRDIGSIRAALVAGEDANQSFAHHDPESDLYDGGAVSPALIWATKLRLPEAIKLLLEAGANPDAQDKRGRNALSILCNWTAEWEKTAKHDNVSPNAHRLEVIELL